MTIFSPRASAMAPHVGDQQRGGAMGAGVQRSDRASGRPVSRGVRRRLHAAAIARSGHERADCRAEALRRRNGLHRLQPQPRSGRRALQASAADRRILVPVLRGDVRAGRAGDDPRFGQLQPGDARHRGLLHRRRYHRLHAIAGRRSVRPLPQLALHHSAWRRRGALSLGPLPRPGRHAEEARPCDAT